MKFSTNSDFFAVFATFYSILFQITSCAKSNNVNPLSPDILAFYANLKFHQIAPHINPIHRDVVAEYLLIRKFGIDKKTIRICDVNSVDENEIRIANTDDIVKLLKIFWPWITNLAYSSKHRTNEEKRRIEQAIVEYCRKTLLSLELDDAGYKLITRNDIVFEKVTDLKLSRTKFDDDLNLARIYPALVSLCFATKMPLLMSSLAKFHPHIRSITYIEEKIGYAKFTYIDSLLEQNTHMKQLRLRKFLTEDSIRSIAKHASNVEKLSVTSADGDGFIAIAKKAPIHFGKVKYFTFIDYSQNVDKYKRFPLTFDAPIQFKILTLASLEFVGGMIKSYESLTVLSIPWIEIKDQTGENYLFDMLEALPKLEKLTLQWSPRFSKSSVEKLLRKVKKQVVFVVTEKEYQAGFIEAMKSHSKWAYESMDKSYERIEGPHYAYRKKPWYKRLFCLE